jgi:hypothetical protein
MKKSQMKFSHNLRHNGKAINLSVSLAPRLSALAVQDELTPVLGPDAIAYLIVTKYLPQRHFLSIVVDLPGNDRRPLSIAQFLMPFEKRPFSSIR